MENLHLTSEECSALERFGIEALVLFGSRAQDIAGPMSDFDFGVMLRNPRVLDQSNERSAVYDTLYDILSSKIKRLTDIDIVFLHQAPMELQSHVAKYGVPLYERTPHSLARFRERVMDQYADFAPLRRVFHQGILSRIPS